MIVSTKDMTLEAPTEAMLSDRTDWRHLASAQSADESPLSTRLAIQGGHVAVAMLILFGLTGSIVKESRILSEREILGIVVFGLIYLGLGLWASLAFSRFNNFSPTTDPVPKPASWKIVLYFVSQFVLAALIFHLARPARSIEALWLILLPPMSHGVMILPRWGLGIVCLAFISIFAAKVGRLHGWRPMAESLPSFLYAVFFTLAYTQIAVSAERVRGRVGRMALELAEANRKLREYAMQVEELAIARERNRLAREIHDSVGHYLTVVNVQIAAAEAVIERDPTIGFEALRKARSLTHEGLQEIRRSVAAFRSSPLDNLSLVECLRVLVSDSAHASLNVDLQILGTVRSLSPKTELTLFRAAQEGLTNVEKHARATRVDVVLDFLQPGAVRLTITDDGIGCSDSSEGGFGLLSLRERAKLLGGDLKTSILVPGGFTLELEVPE